MEISEKSNFRFKAIAIALIAAMIMPICSTCFAAFGVGANAKGDIAPDEQVEIKLGKKVYFEGPTYHRSDMKDSLIWRTPFRVKEGKYTRENPGCGDIVFIALKGDARILIAGEGYIKPEQIIQTSDLIQVKLPTIEDIKTGKLTTIVDIEGEFVDAHSENPAVIKVDKDKGTFSAGIENGTTTLEFVKKDGEKVEILAANYNGQVTIQTEKDGLTANADVNATLEAFDYVELDVEGKGNASIKLTDEGLQVGAKLEKGDATLKAGKEGERKEIATLSMDGEFTATASTEGVKADIKASQTLTITALDGLAIRLREHANAEVNKKEAKASADGHVDFKENKDAQFKEDVIKVDATAEHPWSGEGSDDITVGAGVTAFGKTFEKRDVKVISLIKGGLSALSSKIK